MNESPSNLKYALMFVPNESVTKSKIAILEKFPDDSMLSKFTDMYGRGLLSIIDIEKNNMVFSIANISFTEDCVQYLENFQLENRINSIDDAVNRIILQHRDLTATTKKR